MYASGSDEKVLRIFEAPQAFLDTLALASGGKLPRRPAAGTAGAVGGGAEGGARALGASVAALGLSNKAVYLEEDEAAGTGAQDPRGKGFGADAYTEGPDFVPCALPGVVRGPPLEEHLAQNTLWPEIRKLYGHGNDVYCVCSSPNGRVVASACRAQSVAAATIWLWEVGSWRDLGKLEGHTLTVTQLAFSPDGRYLLAGSRDRSFSVWEVPAAAVGGGGKGTSAAAGIAGAASGASAMEEAKLLVQVKGAHSRLLWGVAWTPDGR
jgi:elongator complex protein 2